MGQVVTPTDDLGETSKKVAAIDCGTNSIRLLVADQRMAEGVKYLKDLEERQTRINRLGFGVDKTRVFDSDALARTFTFEEEYAEVIAKHHISPQNIRFIATSASRDAKNRDIFFEETKRILGVYPEVISGDEEAKLSFTGVASALKDGGNHLVVDLGGGSTELIIGGESILAEHSMNIGSVRITERYFADDDIPTSEHIFAATQDIQNHLDETFKILEAKNNATASVDNVIGVAGTVTTLTAGALGLKKYQRDKVSDARIPFDEMLEYADFMLHLSKDNIRALGFVHPGRVDVIQAGSLIWSLLLKHVQKVMHAQGKALEFTITSEHDILDGIALSI
ncbi:MAG: Ppx/GppA family phosphatase [Candidatus Ancillula sp.]|nr:Ppx/GppA family phosphatase [Candidatus Ancillula sp.]